MRTNNNNKIESIIELIIVLAVNKFKQLSNDKSKKDLINYINNEFLNTDEYKELLSSIKLDNESILEIIYQLLNSINKEGRFYNDNIGKSKKLIKKASNLGFTWPDSDSCFKKVEEEFEELKVAVSEKNNTNIKEEMGDLLFTLHCYANFNHYDFNNILDDANNKFQKRFNKLIEIANLEKLDLNSISPKEKQSLWNKAKAEIKSSK